MIRLHLRISQRCFGSAVSTAAGKTKEKIVILGSGWGGYQLLRKLDLSKYDVTVVSPRNHFLFTPLLASTCVGTLEFRGVIEAVRSPNQPVNYYQAKAVAFDFQNRTIACVPSSRYDTSANASASASGPSTFSVPYDKLVIAVGAKNNTFSIPGVEENAHFLKEIGDARKIREDLLDNFERASAPGMSDKDRKDILHCVIVGGGPTGCEVAAEIHDFITQDLRKVFPSAVVADTRLTLVEAGSAILSGFDEKLSSFAQKHFSKQLIELKLKMKVLRVEKDYILVQNQNGAQEKIPYGLLIWSTGIAPRDVITATTGLKKHASGRVLVDSQLQVEGLQNVFAIGDTAAVRTDTSPNGKILPATAQVASQQGKWLAKHFNAGSRDDFHYQHVGMLAYVGSHKALVDLTGVKATGFGAWLFWRSAYLTNLVSIRNKLLVPMYWFKTLLFGRDVTHF
ncbi:mitochondrial rotenone-insensitive NADH dehydrogenase (NDE2 external NADH dehydrogenase) [Andalucia godoyi]|uniref:Mitochondrial rotenone-insensitive NADH dehydrogenase (NDE2 external NADH dehydrogenase) n=1 Tax=Andalucia godoyi TaxID=505711 RepID=A0A8K0F4L4_ANDGO|nr:mitochondrial rotenone-insensitive NADH dehydrogenase (NDE2 external NADH dehydrogenase) [Andalucia godoyi]|eukprot:ANDGO_07102.mRNA.1 mitochondrial rotenone-insensitive NADH dehydrogenase (NDE2 external NADH dehydrogenase)